MAKYNLAVLFGGVSSEHEVSLISATSVIQNLDREKYNLYLLGITKQGQWYEYTGPVQAIGENNWQQPQYLTPACILPDRTVHGFVRFAAQGTQQVKLDAVFPVLHGKNGEDGTMQGLLELAGIPYVGCDVLSSAMCMDKAVTHTILQAAGIPMANWAAVTEADLQQFDKLEASLREKLGYPMFVKPANAGSSVGVSKAKDADALLLGLRQALQHDRKVVVEQFIAGSEVETAVLGNDDPVAAVVGEIVPKQEFYTYEAKYQDDSTDLYIPARIPDAVAQRIRTTAVAAYRALGCTGLARVDFFYQPEQDRILLNEPNTLPGFTSISMYPKLFAAYGIGYTELLDRLVELAIQRRQSNGR